MRTRLLLTLALAIPPALSAQDGAPVRSGGVTTVVVTAEAPATDDTVRYAVTVVEGVRLFAPRTGAVAARAGEPVRVGLTFGVPAAAPAGRLALGSVELRRGDGRVERREVAVDVAARRAAEFWLGDETLTATAGGTIEIRYGVRNRGNATDTFRIQITTPSTWPSAAIPPAVVVAPGEVGTGILRIALPAMAARGDEHQVGVAVRGVDVVEARSARVVVVGEESRFANLATVPGALFVGSTSGPAGVTPGISLTASGEVRPGTRVSVALRHVDGIAPPAAFRGSLSGPRLRVAAEGADWRARAGDVFSPVDLITGPMNHGRGVDGTYTTGPLTVDGLAAVPWTYFGTRESGHIVRGAARYRTGLGTFGLRTGSVHRAGSLFGTHSQAGASVTYAVRAGGHDVEAEAGIVRVADDSAGTVGPSMRIRYRLDHGPLSFAAHLRTVPATTIRTASQGKETFLSATYRLTDAISATGWAYTNESEPVGAGPHTAADGVSGGFRLGLPSGLNGRLLGNYRSGRTLASQHPTQGSRSVRVGVDLPVLGVMLESDLDVGTYTGLVDYPYRSARAGVRWSGQGQWLWLGVSRHDPGAGTAQTLLDMAGSVALLGTDLQVGLNTRIGGRETTSSATSFWSSLSVPVSRGLHLALGAEHRAGFIESPWRVSVGIRQAVGVPLPLPRTPVLHGIVFEDRNGDGARGADDPGVAGVRVVFGALRTSTGADGEFRFYDAGRTTPALDLTALPAGYIVPAGVVIPMRGYVEIPVVRAGGLLIRVFFDRDGDGVMAEGDTFADGAVVTVVDGAGIGRDAATGADGVVRFGGLAPGTYRVFVHRPGADRRPSAPLELDVVVRPGETTEEMVALPLRALEIRQASTGQR